MALGPGKYDDVCTHVRELAGAETAVVIIVNGKLGSGFSVQSRDPTFDRTVPGLLETLAAQIRADMHGQPYSGSSAV